MLHSFETLGLKIPQIYLPKDTDALDTWCVIACDQYTSDPAYWQQVEQYVGTAPSTLKMVLRKYISARKSSPNGWKAPTAPCSLIWSKAFCSSCPAAVF